MTTILDISTNIPKATIHDFARACSRYREALGNTQVVAMRRGTIALIRGLRARTAKAKRQAPLKDIWRYDASVGPKYITPKGKNQTPQPRWCIRRKGGTAIYVKPYRPKGDAKPALSKAEARARWGQYTRFGLAKKSWGWFMQRLFKRAEPAGENPRAVVRDDMAEGYIREVATGVGPRVEVCIVNKLDYIRKALPEAALSDAMAAATRYIDGQIDKGLAEARKELE